MTSTTPAAYTAATAAVYARTLSKEDRETLAYALEQARQGDIERALVEAIGETLGDLTGVAGVIFFAGSEWGDGCFLDSNARVFYTDDRDPQWIEFGSPAADYLIDLYRTVGKHAGLAIIPSTGETEFSRDDAEGELEAWLTAMTEQNNRSK